MQRIGHGRELPQLVVDYAHTPDALDKALSALKPLAAARGGKLWAVFGCGGDRDRTKRPLMGAAAARHRRPRGADQRQPAQRGRRAHPRRHRRWHRLLALRTHADRAEAIRHAVAQADARDVVVVAGKGHEDYQEIAGIRHPFDDAQQARAALIERAGL